MNAKNTAKQQKTEQRQAIIWGRFSSDQQRDGDSKDRQERLNREIAERLGIKIIAEHFDPAASVKVGATPLFKKIIPDLPKGVGIICENLDRINRSHPWKQKAYLYDIIERGHFIITSQDGMEYNSQSINQMGTVAVGDLQTNLSNAENVKRTARVKEEKAKAVELARQGIPSPLGSWLPPHLKFNFETKQYDIRTDRVKILKRIFKEYIQGKGCVSIAKGLNQDKIPTFRFNRGWSQVTVWTLLRYEGLIGVLNYRGERIPNAFPPAITEKQFYQVQKICEQNKNKRGNYSAVNVRNVFRGICHCSHCGISMRILNNDFIQCRGSTLGKCKISYAVKFSEMESEFLKWFVPQAKDALLGKNNESQSQLQTLEAKLKAIQAKIEQTLTLLDAGVAVKEIQARLVKLEAERKSFENKIAVAKSEQTTQAIMPDQMNELESLVVGATSGNQEIRKRIATIIPSVVKDVRVDLQHRDTPSFKVILADGKELVWVYQIAEYSEFVGVSKDGDLLLGKGKVLAGQYERLKG